MNTPTKLNDKVYKTAIKTCHDVRNNAGELEMRKRENGSKLKCACCNGKGENKVGSYEKTVEIFERGAQAAGCQNDYETRG